VIVVIPQIYGIPALALASVSLQSGPFIAICRDFKVLITYFNIAFNIISPVSSIDIILRGGHPHISEVSIAYYYNCTATEDVSTKDIIWSPLHHHQSQHRRRMYYLKKPKTSMDFTLGIRIIIATVISYMMGARPHKWMGGSSA
jgi:hypothetical protein